VPRYLVIRTFDVDESEMPEVGSRSRKVMDEKYPEIVWEHSHVVVGSDGTPKSFCIYEAPDEEMVREHAERLGDHVVTTIYEVAGDVSPADFPLTDPPA